MLYGKAASELLQELTVGAVFFLSLQDDWLRSASTCRPRVCTSLQNHKERHLQLKVVEFWLDEKLLKGSSERLKVSYCQLTQVTRKRFETHTFPCCYREIELNKVGLNTNRRGFFSAKLIISAICWKRKRVAGLKTELPYSYGLCECQRPTPEMSDVEFLTPLTDSFSFAAIGRKSKAFTSKLSAGTWTLQTFYG